jgi:predicted ATPase
MQFVLLDKNASPPADGRNSVYLRIDLWNDYSFVTMFHMSLHDENGQFHDIGEVKIGFKGQTTLTDTYTRLDKNFLSLGDGYFSLGQGVDFYKAMGSLANEFGKDVLRSLRDIVVRPELIETIKDEEVFSTSLLRTVSLSVIRGQFSRVLEGKPALTDFKFKFFRPESEHMGDIELSFEVVVESIPSTNIHAIIGRNGVGKTTLLNGMIESITNRNIPAKFLNTGMFGGAIPHDFFSSLVSVSFSAFDPFKPPQQQSDPSKGACYFYIGLKDQRDYERNRTIVDLEYDLAKELISCFYKPDKVSRWLKAIEKLGSDENFAAMRLGQLELSYRDLVRARKSFEQPDSEVFRNAYISAVHHILSTMSSGHFVVLLIITKLVSTVEEKTLVLLDEPESHLHPPLLSAFIRALSDLLHDRNALAIIATHSPVVLQEITQACVWKIHRVGKSVTSSRPTIETFGENVGLLTSEVFSLEVERSGFHNLLSKSVESGQSYEGIVAEYKHQLGFEARAILKALVVDRDRKLQA